MFPQIITSLKSSSFKLVLYKITLPPIYFSLPIDDSFALYKYKLPPIYSRFYSDLMVALFSDK